MKSQVKIGKMNNENVKNTEKISENFFRIDAFLDISYNHV